MIEDDDLLCCYAALLEFVISGRRYTPKNPYTIPEVKNSIRAFKRLGYDNYKDFMPRGPAKE